VLSRTFVPNWLVPVVDVQLGAQPAEFADCVPIAAIVFKPLVSVVPFIVIAYPDPALVLALITLVPVLVPVGEKVPRSTLDPVMLPQFEPDVPTQNTSDSGITPVTVTCWAVESAIPPKSVPGYAGAVTVVSV
jgi:hypothetical protein